MISHKIFWVFDIIVLVVAFLVSYFLFPGIQSIFAPQGALEQIWIRFLPPPEIWGGKLSPISAYLWVFIIVTLITIIVLDLIGGHTSLSTQSRTRIILNSIFSALMGLSLVTLILFVFKSQVWSRLLIFSFTVLGAGGLCIYLLALRKYFRYRRAQGYHAKNVLLIGQNTSIAWAVKYFNDQVPREDYRVVGYLDTSKSTRAIDHKLRVEEMSSQVHHGDVEKLGKLLINLPIDEVVAIFAVSESDWITQVIKTCDYLGVLLRIVPEALIWGERRNLRTMYPSEPLHLPAVVLAPRHWNTDSLFIKRIFDILVSGFLLLLLSPIFALVAIAIKVTTPNLPIFYPWHVVGQNGAEFIGYKFTTMVADAEEQKASLAAKNEMTGPVFKIAKDPRVTPLGHFLRKYSINELPQFWSVLRGDMSLVGPRPAARHELERYEFWQKRKLSIKPGITCLWQVRGRNKISNFNDWVAMDLEYIDNWSLWLDLLILFRTIGVVLAGTGS